MGFSLVELAQDVSETTGDAIRNVANKAGNFACALYRDYPAFFVGSIPNPVLRGGAWLTMELLCAPRNSTPPMPDASFVGGQCACIPYIVDIAWQLVDQGQTFIGTERRVYLGKIGGVFIGRSLAGDGQAVFIQAYTEINGVCAETLTPFQVYAVSGSASLSNPRITAIRRQDGGADNCGDPPPRYPDADPPPERLKGDTELVIRPEFAPRVPITFVSPKFEFPLHLKVGDFNVKFDAGGVNIDLGGDGSQDLDEVIKRLEGIEADTADSLSNLKDLTQDTRDFNQDFIDDVNRRNNKNPDADDLEKDPPDDEKEKDNIEYLYGVNLQLLTIPVNAKIQYGVDAPNLYYAGWFEFKRGDFIFPRQPISFVNNFYKAPEGANGFAYTLYVGYEGQSEVIKNTPKEVV